MLRQFTGSKAECAAFYETHNQNNMDEYEIDIDRVIASTGIHVHNGTCRKCKGCLTGCRLCRPQTLRDATMVTQIIPDIDERGNVTYKELESVQQLSTASSQDEFFRQPTGFTYFDLGITKKIHNYQSNFY